MHDYQADRIDWIKFFCYKFASVHVSQFIFKQQNNSSIRDGIYFQIDFAIPAGVIQR